MGVLSGGKTLSPATETVQESYFDHHVTRQSSTFKGEAETDTENNVISESIRSDAGNLPG